MRREPAVVLVFAHKAIPDASERLAFAQCRRILGAHPTRLVCPAGLDISAYRGMDPGIVPDFIPARWLSSLRAYNRLKVLPWLYRRYAAYEYMLTYELDAFVFRDELLAWCREGWDYVGAPLFKGFYDCEPVAPPVCGGNSGFSLRKIDSALRVCGTPRYQRPVARVLADWWTGRFSWRKTINDLSRGNNFLGVCNDYADNEDLFWGDLVPRRFPWFRVAPYEVARRFSFEANPRRLAEEIGGGLPFGCHKWASLDPDFWAAHIPVEPASRPVTAMVRSAAEPHPGGWQP